MHRQYPFAWRAALLAALFAGEAVLATVLLDGAAATPKGSWIANSIHSWGPTTSRFVVAFSALFATFAFLRYREDLKPVASEAGRAPIRGGLLAAHFTAIALFSLASLGVYGDRLPQFDPTLVALVWMCAVLAALATAALAFLPWQFWSDLRRSTGLLWIYAAAAASLTSIAATSFRSLWKPASGATFTMVRLFLSPFVSDMVVQPENLRVGTHRFTVVIANECSGLEGIGLLLVFGLTWLVLFRSESRFPQALVLLPLGIVTLFLLNAFRITALILIGNAGAREVATGGFHSQAGWIMFNSVAFGSSIAARHWSWVSARAPSQSSTHDSDSTAALLVPFLAILAAGILSRAASGWFEWFYPLRFLAALGALWVFRHSYSQLDWKSGTLAPFAGIAVFLFWFTADRVTGITTPMPAVLAHTSVWFRDSWIALRALGATLTVPVAEELAFRGFLLRRLSAIDFESVSFRSTSWYAVLGSAILFGVMHGGRWWLATVAGVVYATLVRRTGRIGDAIVAHAVTNALIALAVVFFGQWQLW